MMNRKYKILPHIFLPQYNKSLYIDSNILIGRNPLDLANKYLHDQDFLLPKHWSRDCIYDEARACIKLGKSGFDETCQQMKKYKKESFPANFGLGVNAIIFRNHNATNIKFLMDFWWKELNESVKRDQLCLAYVLWKSGVTFNYMDENVKNGNLYFRYNLHKKDKQEAITSKIKSKILRIYNRIYTLLYFKDSTE